MQDRYRFDDCDGVRLYLPFVGHHSLSYPLFSCVWGRSTVSGQRGQSTSLHPLLFVRGRLRKTTSFSRKLTLIHTTYIHTHVQGTPFDSFRSIRKEQLMQVVCRVQAEYGFRTVAKDRVPKIKEDFLGSSDE